MKLFRKALPFFVLLAFSLFACQKLFNPLFYTSHDGEGHVIRLIEFTSALYDGQIPVRLAKGINHGLGYPYFNFNYPFIYYLGALLYFLGLSYVASFKALFVISVIGGGVGVYLFCKKFYNTLPSLVAGVFYIITPYRFLNMYVRGAVAEAFALGLLPFLFLSVELIVRREKKAPYIFIVIFSLLILSHNITALFAIPLILFYFVIRIRTKTEKLSIIKALTIGFIVSLLVTSFFWIPALYESGQTKLIELTEDYRMFFPTLQEVLYSPWGFGGYYQGDIPGKMSPQIGIIPLLVILIASVLFIYRFLKKKQEKDPVIAFFLIIAVGFVFLLLPFSLFLWDTLYFLKLMQIPWRVVGYIVLSTAIASAYVVSLVKGKKAALVLSTILILLLIYTNRNHIRVNLFVEFYNPFVTNPVYGPSTTSRDEHMPRRAPRVFENPNPNGDLFASTSGTFRRIVWKSNYHKFEVNLKEQAEFRDNTSYFPGWVATIDGKDAQLLHETDEFYRLRVVVPKGKHTVEFYFTEPWYRKLVDIISLMTFGCIVIFYVIQLSKWKKERKKNLKRSQKK